MNQLIKFRYNRIQYLQNLRYIPSSVFVNIYMCVTLSTLAIETKSLIEFPFRVFKDEAVNGSMTLRKSLVSSSICSPDKPR